MLFKYIIVAFIDRKKLLKVTFEALSKKIDRELKAYDLLRSLNLKGSNFGFAQM